ncbi:VOC family protein [Paenibacillus sp. YYML68]|uniref:VOC family protein n=1 Tax=Paenibacillus sp. YYML68 TaxID=2909250 RepID=UPI00249107FB|nr:VOC family protein [Paenibacillus sp. YYML68]
MKIGHVGINVTNLERSVPFYCEVFQLTVFHRSDESGKKFAFLGREDEITITLWEQSNGVFSSQSPGMHHFAFEASSLDDVKLKEKQLKSMGVAFIYPDLTPHMEGAESGGIYFLDPDGIRLEIYAKTGLQAYQQHTTEGPACGFF